MSVTLVNNSPQLTVATAGTRGLTGAHVVSAAFSGSNLILTLSNGAVVNAGGAILSSSGSNNWVGQQAINGNVIVSGSFIVSGSNTFVNIGPASFSGSLNVSGSTIITGSLIVSGGTINVIGTNLFSASQQVTFLSINGATTYTQSVANLINQSTASLSSSINVLSGSVAVTTANLSSSIGSNRTALSSSVSNVTSASNARIANLEVASGSIRSNFNSYTSSADTSITALQSSASNALSTNNTQTSRLNLLETESGSLLVSASSLRTSASNMVTRTSAILQATESLHIFSSSVNQFTSSAIQDINSLYSTVASINTFTSSVIVRSTFNSYTQSVGDTLALTGSISSINTFTASAFASFSALQVTASSLTAYTTSSDSDINNLEISASSLVVSASSLRTSASTALSTNNSQTASINSLNSFSSSVNDKFDVIGGKTGSYATTSSVNTLSASVDSRLTSIEEDSGSWGASTNINSLNTFTASALVSFSALQVTASSLTAYTSSNDGKWNTLGGQTGSFVTEAETSSFVTNVSMFLSKSAFETHTSSLNTYSSSINTTTASLNSFTSSTDSKFIQIAISTGSLLVSASSLIVSASALTTSASTAFSTNNSQANRLTILESYSSSLSSAIDVSNGNLTVLGNLTVQGDTTTLNTTNLIVEDKLIELAKGTTTSAEANGGGIYISGADASITWNHGQSRVNINKALNVSGNITLTGTVDGVEISQLSSSFNTISASYLLESASVSASIKTLNAYTASNNSNITAIHTVTASLNTFTSSTYTTFSASVDSRLDSVEGSIGGAGIGSTVNDLIVSASASVLINTQQQITLNVLANGSPSASVNSVIRLAATASNLTGQVTNQETRLISQTGSINTLFQSASSLTSSIAAIVNLNNQQSDKLSLLENFTGSTFTNYTQSVSQSITQLSASIGGGNISGLVNGLTSSVSNLTITQSGISASNSALSASYNAASSSFRIQISQLQDQKDSYVDFVSGSRSGSYMSFPPFSQSVDDRFGSMLSNINQLSSSSFLDSEQVTYSASVALVTSASQGSLFNLSSSIWNTATGLSKSINTSISESFRSASNSINSIVVGTGFIPRPEFNNITSSFSASISASNAFSASVTRSVNNNVLSASALQTTASNLSAYTSSLQLALQPNGNNVNVSGNLYVSGNIIAQQYIVSSSEIYITQSNYNYSGSNLFGNDYGDEHTFSGSIKLFGPLVMRAGLLGQGSQPTFIDVAGSITSSGTLNSNGVSSSYISASTFVSASNFYGEYNGVSTQVHLSQSIGYNSLTASISGAINAASNSLSASITTTIDTLSGSVDVLFTSASSLRISASANRNNIIFLYTSASSLETSASLLSVITSASIASGSANKQSGSVLFTSASSLQLSASALQTSASVMITSASNLSAYTHSLQQAISVTGSNTRILGNVEVTSNLIVSGTITAQEYYSELISSSIIYESGSTKFGDDGGDNHNFTGSVYVVGSISSSATITAATHSGYINANNGVVSGSSQFVEYGGALTSSNTFIGTQTTNGVLKVSGSTTLTGSVGVDLRSGSEFYVRNGVTRIDSVLFVTDNDYVNSSYVGGNVSVNNYLASGYTAHYDGGVQITGSLNVKAGQNGSGSYFIGNLEVSGGSIIITGSNSNLQVMGNTSVSGNLNSTNISASSNLYGAGLEINGNSRLNGQVDLDTTQITIGAGANAVVDETRMNTLNLRVDSDTFFNSNITAISGSTRFKSVAINDLSMSRIPYVDSTDTLVDSANFTYNGVTFKVGGGAFEIDDATGNIRTSGSLKVDGATTLHSTLNVTGSVGITGSLIVTGSTIISSSLRVGNTASFAHLNVTGSTILSNRLQVGTNAAISGNLGVIGSVALSSSLFVSGNITASANANISGDVAITGSLSAVGPIIQLGNLPFVDRTIISGALELSGSYHTMTTNLKATGSTSPADAIYRLTEAQAWSSSFTTDNTSSGAWIRTPDEYLEYFVGQGSNKRRYITPVWLDETLYADDYFDISVTVGADSDYVF